MFSKKRGFTLIELLTVITIIGVLVAIVSVSYGRYKVRARDTRRKADLKLLNDAMTLYAVNNKGQLPIGSVPSKVDYFAQCAKTPIASDTDIVTNWNKIKWPSPTGISDYIASGVLPLDPLAQCNLDGRWPWDNAIAPYTALINKDGHFSVWAILENTSDPDRNGGTDFNTRKYKNLFSGSTGAHKNSIHGAGKANSANLFGIGTQ